MVLAFGAIGFGAFAILPSVWTFLICLLVFYPVSGSAYGQLFAVIRAETNALGSKQGAATNSVVRSVYAASWIVVPGLVGLFIATRKNVSDSFAVAAAAFVLCFVIYALFGSRDKNKNLGQSTVWVGFKTALGLVGSRAILFRVLALALIAPSYSANATLLPLFITHLPGGSTTDVGVLAGLVAGLEIPFMLIGGFFLPQHCPLESDFGSRVGACVLSDRPRVCYIAVADLCTLNFKCGRGGNFVEPTSQLPTRHDA